MRRLGNGLAVVLVAALGLSSFAAAGTGGRPRVQTCAALARGASGPAVATVQREVGATPDGDFGPLTAAAVSRWQKAHHVRASGRVDAATWKALPAGVGARACGQRVSGSGVAVGCATLAVGSTGVAVAVLQRAVRVDADGDFGPITRAAVMAAQRRLRLAASGVATAATWARLGLGGTPACPTTSTSEATAAAAPAPVAGTGAQQARIRAEVATLAARLSGRPGVTHNPIAARALAFARAQTGKPYQWGGTGPGGYDCSGLVMASYQAVGITTPRIAADQYGVGAPVPLDRAEQGDLLFYASDVTRPSTIYHVVLYAGSGRIVDAPYTGAFVGTRRLWTQDLLPVAWRPASGLVLPARVGTTGWTVRQIQLALDRHGASLSVDGGYGPITAAAVRQWQAAHRLRATGVTDMRTWVTLRG